MDVLERPKTIRSYRDLEIWQEGIALAKRVYELTQAFPKDESFGLSSQMKRSAVSVSANIAEGEARQHRAEYRQFLHVTLGSLAELETLAIIAQQVGLITAIQLQESIEQPIASIRNKTLALVRRLK